LDDKTFKGILDVNPYRDEAIVLKKECMDHIEKNGQETSKYKEK